MEGKKKKKVIQRAGDQQKMCEIAHFVILTVCLNTFLDWNAPTSQQKLGRFQVEQKEYVMKELEGKVKPKW